MFYPQTTLQLYNNLTVGLITRTNSTKVVKTKAQPKELLYSWTIRFTFFVFVSMDGILAPSLLPQRTSPASAALAIYWTMIKPCVACSCVDIRCLLCCCFYFSVVVSFFVGFVAVAPPVVGFCTMMYVIFAPLYVGLLWALLYSHLGFLPSWLIGSLSSC